MASWLYKTEPSTYAYADLEREGRTRWEGVSNPMAVKHLREAKAGDRVVIYHTGKERRAVGLARVATAGDPPELVPEKPLVRAVSLDELKASPAFRTSPLLKIGRLSVVPLTPAQEKALLALGKTAV
jgi:predicted RNA-binding protein with PUA-like domain